MAGIHAHRPLRPCALIYLSVHMHTYAYIRIQLCGVEGGKGMLMIAVNRGDLIRSFKYLPFALKVRLRLGTKIDWHKKVSVVGRIVFGVAKLYSVVCREG